ncbi:MAG: SusC/RagA family TonB-linked outer membrane protein, partial [Bacteroidota bacterium]
QGKVITGKVTSASSREGIPGVNIVVKGTAVGTITDVEGNYSIAAENNSILVFSSIGYISQEIKVEEQTSINISLADDVKALEEVVVVGYGEQKRSNVTGALSVVKVADMENKTQFRLDQALQGMAAGVNVTRNGGAPGSAPTIHVRGVGSIGNTAPLWIIDGIRMDPGNSFDVNDVESMEVLKDASASAIYGVQAANGVIIVKTKRGKNGLQVNFKTSIGQRHAMKLPHLLNSADYVKYKKESRLNAGQNPEPGWDNYTADTDWIGAFYNGSGMIQSNSVSVAKGDEKINYYFSFGNDNEKGILIDNTYKRYSMRLNSDVMLTKWLKLGETLILSKVIENPISNNNESYTGGIPYRSVPTMPIYDKTNPYGGWGRGEAYFQGPNPVATQYQQHETRTSNRLDGNAFLEAKPLTGLTVRSTVGLNYYSYLVQQFNEAFDYGFFSTHIAQLTYGYATTQALTANVVATYNKKISKHDFKIMGGYESWQSDGRHFNVTGNGYPIQVAQSLNLTTGAIASTDRYNVDQDRLLSQFGRFNYNYDNKYLFEANIRRDGSSKFAPQYRWGVFPSFSAGWKISEEKFFQSINTITSLKLRASWGKLGYTGGIGNFAYQSPYTSQFSTYSFDAAGSNKTTGYYLSRFSNNKIRWEESNMTDIAIDMALFQNKFTVSVDLYRKDTEGLLVPVPVAAS